MDRERFDREKLTHLRFLIALGGYHLGKNKIGLLTKEHLFKLNLPSVGIYLAAVTRSRESKKLSMMYRIIINKLIQNSTHNPDDSSNLTFCFRSSSWTIGQLQICFKSCEHACSMDPGSSGSSQSIPSWLSKLVRSSLMSRLKACFQGVLELMATSLNTCFGVALR